MKAHLEIPLASVIIAEQARQEARRWLRGIRLGGTLTPGVIAARRFYSIAKAPTAAG